MLISSQKDVADYVAQKVLSQTMFKNNFSFGIEKGQYLDLGVNFSQGTSSDNLTSRNFYLLLY